MKKLLKRLVIFIVIIGTLGYGVYYFGTQMVSTKIAESVSAEMENTNNVLEIKEVVNNNPEIKEYIEEGASVEEESLPFTTMEEATKVVVQKVGLVELQKLQLKYADGISQADIPGIVHELEGNLTEQEILAIKAIAYKELNK